MSSTTSLTVGERRLVAKLVSHYEANQELFTRFVGYLRELLLTDGKPFSEQVHSMKWRVKDPTHLRDKLKRKILRARQKGEAFDLTKENLFDRITDLAGYRILHLHTRQMQEIDQALRARLQEQRYPIIEGPIARTWDDETRKYFEEINISTVESDTFYTSVHYIIQANSQTSYTCEIQVRTLAEEIWGEVAHSINYPYPSKSVACTEQLKVLARVASSTSRLVDAIFKSYDADERMRSTASQLRKKLQLGHGRRRSRRRP